MTLSHVDDDRLLEAHDRSNNDSLEATMDQALRIYADLKNAEELLDDDREELPA